MESSGSLSLLSVSFYFDWMVEFADACYRCVATGRLPPGQRSLPPLAPTALATCSGRRRILSDVNPTVSEVFLSGAAGPDGVHARMRHGVRLEHGFLDAQDSLGLWYHS